MRSKNNFNNIYCIVLTALFAAIITVTTALLKIHTGINEGYIHFGDTFIYLAACTLPASYAILSAAVGAALADILAGAAVWVPATAVIKALNVIPFVVLFKFTKRKSTKILSKYMFFIPVISGAVTVLGYYIAEGLMYSFPSAAVSVPFSILQASASAVLFYALSAFLDKINFKQKIIK